MSLEQIQIVNAAIDVIKSNGTVGAGLLAGIYLRDVVNEIVKKLTFPAADAIGNLFGKIIELGTFQSPYSRDAAVKIGRTVVEICEKHENAQATQFVESVPPEIDVPLFNKLSYFEDGDLRELLTSLLASSMLKSGQVHPSVISLIDRLSSSEAKMLKALAKSGTYGPWPSVTVKAALSHRADGLLLASKSEILASTQTEKNKYFDDFIANHSGQSNFRDIGAQHVSDLELGDSVTEAEDVFFCASNLRLLGIVELTDGYVDNKIMYVDLVARAYKYIELARTQTGCEPIIERSKLSITSIGRRTIGAFNL
jgi:Abortive infection alpha